LKRPARNTLIRYFQGTCEPHEKELVKLYLSMDIDRDFVESCMKEVWSTDLEDYAEYGDEIDLQNFRKRFTARQQDLVQFPKVVNESMNQRFRFLFWVKVVAASVILVGTSLLVMHKNPFTVYNKHFVHQDEEILPGSNKASLTLEDGSIISLSEADNGTLTHLQGLHVDKTSDGEIVYKVGKDLDVRAESVHSIQTPNGGQYAVVLPDGSKAWLNSASSLTYPVNFSNQERRVKMTGEIYFDIVKVSNKRGDRIPFFVETEKQLIQVLGTQFNVNAYKNEPYSHTTLVKGSVKVTSIKNGKSVLLQPGEQASLGDDFQIVDASMEEELAWRNGDFVFNQEPLSSVLRKISRWYDVDVECPSALGELKLTGMISRNQPLSDVVKSISSLGKATIKIKERRVVVEP